MQMENIKMYEKTEKSEKTGKQKKFEREELLRIKHLSVTFTQYDGWFSRKTLPVIRDLSLSVSRGEMVAVVGSSGSGKSLLAHAVMGVLPYNGKCGGDIYYKGEQLTSKRIKKLRGHECFLSGPIDESGRAGSRRERTDQFGKKPEGTGPVWP